MLSRPHHIRVQVELAVAWRRFGLIAVDGVHRSLLSHHRTHDYSSTVCVTPVAPRLCNTPSRPVCVTPRGAPWLGPAARSLGETASSPASSSRTAAPCRTTTSRRSRPFVSSSSPSCALVALVPRRLTPTCPCRLTPSFASQPPPLPAQPSWLRRWRWPF